MPLQPLSVRSPRLGYGKGGGGRDGHSGHAGRVGLCRSSMSIAADGPIKVQSSGAAKPAASDGAEAAKPDGSKSAEAAKPESNDTIFVHFIPPPLRAAGKKDLCWIVHTCNGTGCREVKHVTFHTVDSFSTFEGPPPDQSCGCNVANHHLRGRGAVIYNEVAQEAVIESTDPDAQINAGAYKADAKKLAAELARLKATIKHLRTAQHVKQLQGLHRISRCEASEDDEAVQVRPKSAQEAVAEGAQQKMERRHAAALHAAVSAATQKAREERRAEVAQLTEKIARIEVELVRALQREEANTASRALDRPKPCQSCTASKRELVARADAATATSSDALADPVVLERHDFVQLVLTLRALRERQAVMQREAAELREQHAADRKLIRQLSEVQPRYVLASFTAQGAAA